jgi:hypothetical protein
MLGVEVVVLVAYMPLLGACLVPMVALAGYQAWYFFSVMPAVRRTESTLRSPIQSVSDTVDIGAGPRSQIVPGKSPVAQPAPH